MKVKGIILTIHFLNLCSMYDSSTTKTTNGLHEEIPDDIPRIETSENVIKLPGLIAIICITIIIIITSAYCAIKKYCWRNQQSASLDISQTPGGECFSTSDTTYPVISYWTVYPSWAPPVYPTSPTLASDISQSDVLPPRYSSIFDDNGQEMVPVNV